MVAAVWPHRDAFVTPMAAVAGAVADDVLAALVAGRDLNRVYINGFKTLATGMCRYGVMLRDDGIIFDDGTVARMDEAIQSSLQLMSGGGPAPARRRPGSRTRRPRRRRTTPAPGWAI